MQTYLYLSQPGLNLHLSISSRFKPNRSTNRNSRAHKTTNLQRNNTLLESHRVVWTDEFRSRLVALKQNHRLDLTTMVRMKVVGIKGKELKGIVLFLIKTVRPSH